jgi:hypothetical protein
MAARPRADGSTLRQQQQETTPFLASRAEITLSAPHESAVKI